MASGSGGPFHFLSLIKGNVKYRVKYRQTDTLTLALKYTCRPSPSPLGAAQLEDKKSRVIFRENLLCETFSRNFLIHYFWDNKFSF